ncbi:MAG TPA: 5-formyltetrahydrofolate cyclo-ligase [Verrucomicrobiales bacterium]|nr:5-formyltetrahydrofolate cyclo-ligase [Verrucomicrobiales bacterium]
MTEAAELKRQLRRELRARVARLMPDERNLSAERVVGRISQHASWRQARTVMLFVPLPDEVDVLRLVDEAIGHGKTVLLPRYKSEADGYEPARIENVATDLVVGRFGVAEPASDCPGYPLKSLDVTLVPGLGFDLAGRRLGRGRGYYDRLLVGAAGRLWGVGFDCQLLPELPVETHDVVLNCIVTPSRCLEVVARAVE